MSRALFCALFLSLCATTAEAQVGMSLRHVGEGEVRVDGRLREWRNVRFVEVGSGVDAYMRYAIGYDASTLYVAATVRDERMVRTTRPGPREDAIILTLALPVRGRLTGTELYLFAGVEGSSASSVAISTLGGRPRALGSAEIVEGPNERGAGYVLEASIPLRDIPGGDALARGHGAIRLRDVDAEARPEVESEPSSFAVEARALDRMPSLLVEDGVEPVLRAFLERNGVASATPRYDLSGQVAGDAREERVQVVDRYVVVSGPGYGESGTSVGFYQLAIDGARDLERAELVDLTGDGVLELLCTIRQSNEYGARTLTQVIALEAEHIRPIWSVETRKSTSNGSVTAELEVRRARRGAATIVVSAGEAEGLDENNYREAPATDAEPIPLPWGTTLSRTYRWDGARFAVTAQRANPHPRTPTAPVVASPTRPVVAEAPPAAPSIEEMIRAIRRERHIADAVRVRFAQNANLAENATEERLVVLGKLLVVLGPGFRGGTGFFASELGVATPEDILSVDTEDLTGDAREEVLVRVRQTVASDAGDVVREILLVHRFTPSGFPRIAQIELARQRGEQRVENELHIATDGRSKALEIRPGRARGYDATSWPFGASSSDGIDPVLLPWRDRAVRYRFANDRLTRAGT